MHFRTLDVNQEQKFNNSQIQTIQIVTIVANSLSMVGCMFIIISFLLIKKLRLFAFKLIICLSISDFINIVGNLIIIDTTNVTNNQASCQIAALLINFGGLASVFWTTVIAYILYQIIVKINMQIDQKEWRYYLYAYGVPFIFSLIPFMSSDYGVSGSYNCWIKFREDQRAREIFYRLFEFYIPLWIAIIFNSIVFAKVTFAMKKMYGNQIGIKDIKRLRFYPVNLQQMLINFIQLVLIICFFIPTINRLYSFFKNEVFILNVLHVFCVGIYGLFNAIIYGYTDRVKREIKKIFQKDNKMLQSSTTKSSSDYSDSNELNIQQKTVTFQIKVDKH